MITRADLAELYTLLIVFVNNEVFHHGMAFDETRGMHASRIVPYAKPDLKEMDRLVIVINGHAR